MEVDFFLFFHFGSCLGCYLFLGVVNDRFIGIAVILFIRHVLQIARFTELDVNGIDGKVR